MILRRNFSVDRCFHSSLRRGQSCKMTERLMVRGETGELRLMMDTYQGSDWMRWITAQWSALASVHRVN
jgi:hypothetical protein